MSRLSWGILPEVNNNSDTITRDTLPPNYAQFYQKDGNSRVFFNINNSITSMPIADASTIATGLTIANQANKQILYYNATNSSWTGLPSGASTYVLFGDLSWGAITTRQLFTSTASFTAPSGVSGIFLTMSGGGGGGGGAPTGVTNSGGGGGSSAYTERTFAAVTAGNVYPVIVGSIGTGGAAGDNSGGSGGNSSFYCATVSITVTGGGGGAQGSVHTGGGAGAASSSASGGTGGKVKTFAGLAGADGATDQGGGGAGSPFGEGGAGGHALPGSNGIGYGVGGGGAGGNGSGNAGGDGGSGFVLIEY